MGVYTDSDHNSNCIDGSEHSGTTGNSNSNTGSGHSGTVGNSNSNTGSGHSGTVGNSNNNTGLGGSGTYSSSECTTRSFSEITDKFTHLIDVLNNNEINEYTIPPNIDQEYITQHILDEIAILTSDRSETTSVSSGFHGISCGSESSYLSEGLPNINMYTDYKDILTSISIFESTLDEYI